MSKRNTERHRRSVDLIHTTRQLNFVFERDNGICQLCYLPCSREDASRDHIKELKDCVTREEARDNDNVRLAHKTCNNFRSNHRLEDLEPKDYPNIRKPKPLTQNLAEKLRALGLITMDDLPP